MAVRGSRSPALAWLALLVLVAGCATPAGVNRSDRETVQHQLTANAISSGVASATTMQTLRQSGLYPRWESEPQEVIRALHAELGPERDRALLFALAELSYLHGIAKQDASHLLAAAVYAYALLLPEPGRASDIPAWDPRLRIAFDLYDRSLAEAFGLPDGAEVRFEPGRRALPFGTLDVELAPVPLWAGYRIDRLYDCGAFEVRGLSNRHRTPGIGAALAATLASSAEPSAPAFHHRIPPRLRIPVTAFLRIESPAAHWRDGALRARLELYTRDDESVVRVGQHVVPLEVDATTPLALTLEGSPIWETEVSGFFTASVAPFQRVLAGTSLGADRLRDGLFLLHPYRPGRIPLVLVHGTASSPARWAELVNEIENDPHVGARVQVWLFTYNTGNPILYSAAQLREALDDVVHELDPGGRDPALRQMVVAGHSQGGLLTKLTVVDSGDRFWDRVSTVPLDRIDADDATRALLQRTMFVKPSPFVKRVVFMSTPHRGSYLATFSVARWVSDLITLPLDVSSAMLATVTRNQAALSVAQLHRLPTSVDNMTPGNGFLQTLLGTPIVPWVSAHSIIPVLDDGPLEEEKDGVVAYTSAHLDGVESEKVVRHSGHSVQGTPEAVEEMRRILIEHTRAFAPAPAALSIEESTSASR